MIRFNFSVIDVCWIIFLIYWIFSSFFVKKSVVKRDPGWILWRIAVVALIISFIRFDKSGAVSLFMSVLNNSLFSFKILGTVLTVLGLLVAILARIYLGRNWSSYVTYKENHELVTSGPYRLIRHPIYTGMLLMFTGAVLYYGMPLLFVFYAITAGVFIWRIGKEEKIMTKLFGKRYRDYIKKTKALIPFVA